MERLTGWDKNNAFFAKCFDEPCLGSGCRNDNCELNELVCTRLAEYEDLGVTPEQIREIDKLYTEKCREVVELKRLYEKTFSELEELDDRNREYVAEIRQLERN